MRKLMNVKLILVFLLIAYACTVEAQSSGKKGSSGKKTGLLMSGTVWRPLGDFSNTHWLGIGADIMPYTGLFIKNRESFGLKIKGGAAYYAGKKEVARGYDYHYPGMVYVHSEARFFYVVANTVEFFAETGPAIRVYDGNTRFAANVEAGINFRSFKNCLIGPSFQMIKDFGANELWSAGLKATFIIKKPSHGGLRQ